MRGVGIHRTDDSRKRGSSRVGLLMAAVVVEMERMERIMTVREGFGLSCRMNSEDEEDEYQLVEQEEQQAE